jgi:hypothetical protein
MPRPERIPERNGSREIEELRNRPAARVPVLVPSAQPSVSRVWIKRDSGPAHLRNLILETTRDQNPFGIRLLQDREKSESYADGTREASRSVHYRLLNQNPERNARRSRVVSSGRLRMSGNELEHTYCS